MKQAWTDLNLYLNHYGGLVGLISFLVSLIIYMKTGQIKKNIKNLLDHSHYVKTKNIIRNNLEGILESINLDNIYDQKIIGELNREISTLRHYSDFFDGKTKRNVKKINSLLGKNFINIDRNKLVNLINKVIGDLKINDTYLG